jgi:hypothetical protein
LQFLEITPEFDLRIQGDEKNIKPVAWGTCLMFVTEGGQVGIVYIRRSA